MKEKGSLSSFSYMVNIFNGKIALCKTHVDTYSNWGIFVAIVGLFNLRFHFDLCLFCGFFFVIIRHVPSNLNGLCLVKKKEEEREEEEEEKTKCHENLLM